MKWLPAVALSATLVALCGPSLAVGPPPPGYRYPLFAETYDFTAQITSQVLQDGTLVATDNQIPASWEGGLIRGRLTLDFNKAEIGYGESGGTVSEGDPTEGRFGNWLTVAITNPDGQVVTIPAAGAAPQPSGPNNHGTLVTDDGWRTNGPNTRSSFTVERTFAEAVGSLSQLFKFELGSNYLSERVLVTQAQSWEYTGLHLDVNVANADNTNAGFLRSIDANGNGFQYGFSLRNFALVSPVPEPELAVLAAAGLMLVGWRTRHARRRSGEALAA